MLSGNNKTRFLALGCSPADYATLEGICKNQSLPGNDVQALAEKMQATLGAGNIPWPSFIKLLGDIPPGNSGLILGDVVALFTPAGVPQQA